MPTYDLECSPCKVRWDVTKPMADYDRPEPCPTCGHPGLRLVSMVNIDKTAAGGWNTQTFNPALGCYTRSDQHAQKIAKSRGLECVGNEVPEKIHAHFDRQRADKREQGWQDAMRIKQFGD